MKKKDIEKLNDLIEEFWKEAYNRYTKDNEKFYENGTIIYFFTMLLIVFTISITAYFYNWKVVNEQLIISEYLTEKGFDDNKIKVESKYYIEYYTCKSISKEIYYDNK